METRELVAAIADAENERDWARLAELFDEQITIMHPGIGPVIGRDANISAMLSTFPARCSSESSESGWSKRPNS